MYYTGRKRRVPDQQQDDRLADFLVCQHIQQFKERLERALGRTLEPNELKAYLTDDVIAQVYEQTSITVSELGTGAHRS